MTVTTRSNSFPQMGFDFLLTDPGKAYINKPGSQSLTDLATDNPSGIAAGDALSRMVVDDRALKLGITNWRALLDHALATGHVELYQGDDGRIGLRKPGLRFGPIAQMPDAGPEYVKRAVLAKLLSKAARHPEGVKSGRVTAGGSMKVECTLEREAILLAFYDGRKHAGELRVRGADLPFCHGNQVSDAKIQAAFFISLIESELPFLEDQGTLATAALKSIAAALKVLGN